MTVRWTLAAGLLLAVLAGAVSSPETSLAAAPPSYTIEAALEYDAGVVTARETVVYTNKSSQTLDSVVFTATPAYYGAFQLLRAAVDSQEVRVSLDGSIMELTLPKPVPPGASAMVALDFTVRVPLRGGRFGRGSQVIALGNWFPVLAVYRDGRLIDDSQDRGWVRGRYVEMGDAFFSETSDFLVTLQTDRTVKIAHTGDLVSQIENTWKFEARGVRDFALAVSTSFASVSQDAGGIAVRVFYLPGHEAAAGSYLRAAVETVAWLKQAVAPYPYGHLDLAEINAGGSTTVGQEYPNLIFMADNVAFSAGGNDSYGNILASHETAHQWFYGIIGNDQLYEPWLDEAMVTWLSYHLLRIDNVPLFGGIWQNRVLSPTLPDLPVNAGIYTYPNEGPYLALVYRRGAVFLEELHSVMGDAAFFAALKDYGTAMSGRVGTPYAFLDTMQAHTQTNLNPIIARYFTYSRYREAEPLRVSASYLQQPWSGAVRITVDSSASIRDVQVYIDDSFYMRALPGQIYIETGQFDEGAHLLTLRAGDGQQEADVIGTFTVKHPARPTLTPLPAPPEGARMEVSEAQTPEQPAGVPTAAPAPAPVATGEGTAAGAVLVALSVAMLAWALTNTNRAER